MPSLSLAAVRAGGERTFAGKDRPFEFACFDPIIVSKFWIRALSRGCLNVFQIEYDVDRCYCNRGGESGSC